MLLRAPPPLLQCLPLIIATFLLPPTANGAAQFVFFGNQFGDNSRSGVAAAAASPVFAAVSPAEVSQQQATRQGKAIDSDAPLVNNVIGDAPGGRDGLETIFFGQVTRSPRPAADALVVTEPPHFETTATAAAAAGGVATTAAPIDDTLFFGQVTRSPRPVVTSEPRAAVAVLTAAPSAAAAIVKAAPLIAATAAPPRQVADTLFFGQVTRPPRPSQQGSSVEPSSSSSTVPPATTTSTATSLTTTTTSSSSGRLAAVDPGDTIFFGQVTRPPRTSTPSSNSSRSIDVATTTATSAPLAAVTASRVPAAKDAKHVWQGHNYYLSWRTGQNNFEWAAGVAFCNSLGMRSVSLDSPDKVAHFLELVATERPLYFWTGGEVLQQQSADGDDIRLKWLSGKEEKVVRGEHPWSPTGGKSGSPQPDGAGVAAERCLAVQNNLFR